MPERFFVVTFPRLGATYLCGLCAVGRIAGSMSLKEEESASGKR
ncbi:hypothetical protein Sros_3890 [Streptosporangium roseum DSM 43021]|uniref:Uncharacterized protein n=1 Tax=Streptosporangium roseum (strain ATCC 12428 / DSM 43021 / JCM 3005 / KCTC 9067 / NCIMB 10171 / NRRL 2505 / NI 9100) TaxID=479432 RepID=D2AUU5_STRRD|nr:hypothetical protein Sros_3890 [Streptosporangium roseum DSM 43021]